MAIRNLSGAEFKAFYEDPSIWTLDGNDDVFYCEDLVIVVQGHEHLDMDAIYGRYGENFENLPDDAVLEFQSGYRLLNGSYGQSISSAPEEDMLVLFREWQKNRADVTFVATISVPKGDADALARVERALADLADLGVVVKRSDEAAPARKPGRALR